MGDRSQKQNTLQGEKLELIKIGRERVTESGGAAMCNTPDPSPDCAHLHKK